MPTIEFNLSTIILLVFGLVNLPLSIWIFKNNPKSWTNRLFSALIVSLTIYLVVNTELYVFEEHQTRLFIGRAIMANAAILNVLVFLFLSIFPDSNFTVSKKITIPIFIATIPLFFAAFTNLIFKDINISENNTVTPVPGILLPAFGLHTFLLILGGLLSVFKRRKKTEGLERIRINYMLFAFGLLFFLILTFNFIFPVILNYGALVPFLPVYILIFLGVVSYAIARHQLFGLRVLATQVFTIIIWLILLSNLFTEQDSVSRIIDGLVLLFSIVSGILLIRSVIKEVEQREKLEELTQKLEALDKQKNEFISMAAHELRAPMTAIKGYLSMVMEGDTGDIPEKARGFLADANNINERLVRLVNNMLNVSRIEEGRMAYQMELDNLSHIVRSVYSQFVPEAERKGLKYKLDIPTHIKDKIKVDSDKIQEVIGNFLSNAIKYTEKGAVTVKLSQPTPSIIKCEVIDTGPGISKEEQTKLFQKFYRVETNVGKTTGTGLGLYISRLLIENFSGKIGIDSDGGLGSNFWFELPLAEG